MSKQHTWRELIYIGQDSFSGDWQQFAAESESARLDGRGGLGWRVEYHPRRHQSGDTTEYISCNCPAFKDDRPDSCWHAREAPKASFYWTQRERFTAMERAEFDTFYAKWWPRYTGILGSAKRDGQYKGQDADRWELFFAALLNEWAARTAADTRVKQSDLEPTELTTNEARFVALMNRTFGTVKKEVVA